MIKKIINNLLQKVAYYEGGFPGKRVVISLKHGRHDYVSLWFLHVLHIV